MEPGEEVTKRRLVDRDQIAAAVDYMRARGMAAEIIAVELARFFYVDMDELNAVLAEPETARHLPAMARARPVHPRL